MLFSSLFARWIAWLGLVAGTLLVVGGIESSAATGSSGFLHDVGGLPISLFWIWMIATAIILFRASPGREATTP